MVSNRLLTGHPRRFLTPFSPVARPLCHVKWTVQKEWVPLLKATEIAPGDLIPVSESGCWST